MNDYQDPKSTKIEAWKWHPMERIRQELAARRELPEHVMPYAGYMRDMHARAQAGDLNARDLIKAYTITQSSIGRGGLGHATATKRGIKLPNTGGEVRPEGAFSEWLGSPMGQKYLEASMRGEDHPEALRDLRTKFAPFGKQNVQVKAMQYATQNAPALAEQLNAAITGSKADYRKYAGGIKGIASAKSGFIGSLLGRGDLPTLDARQLNLHSLSHPTKKPESMMSRGKGLGGQEAVDRLIARQESLGYEIPDEYKDFAQHLIHHDIWDQRGGTRTTHGDLIKAMRHYGGGGDVVGDKPAKKMTLKQIAQMQRDLEAAKTVGHLKDTPLKPHPLVGTRYVASDPTGLAPKTPVDLEEHKGSSLMLMPWDSTSRNVDVSSISGRALPTPVRTHGGQDYARDIEHMRQGVAGASGEDIAKKIASRESNARIENELAGGTGKILHLPITMGDRAEDFSMMPTEILHHLVQMGDLSPSEIERMDNEIRNHFTKKKNKKIYPFGNFVGLNHPDFHRQIVTGEGLGTTAGELRKAITDRLGYLKSNAKVLDFNVEDMVNAITDPSLRGVPKGHIGNTVIGSDPDQMSLSPSANRAYDTNFSGKYLGTLGHSFPAEELFGPRMAALHKEFENTQGHKRNMVLGALEKRGEGVSQILDNPTLDRYGEYLRKRDQLLKTGSYAKGGAVSQDQMLASTMLGKKKGPSPSVKNVGVDEAPDMAVKRFVSPGMGKGNSLPTGGVDFQPQMPGQQLSQAAPGGPGAPGMPQGGPGMPPGAPGLPPPLPRNQPGMPTGKPVGVQAPEIPPPKQKPAMGSNILSMTPQGQALAAMSPMRKMATGGKVTLAPSIEQMRQALSARRSNTKA